MRSPSPISISRLTVPCSRTPARIVVSTSSLLRLSSTIESMPSRASKSDNSNPAGPAPMIPTCVRIFIKSSPRTSLHHLPVLPKISEQRDDQRDRSLRGCSGMNGHREAAPRTQRVVGLALWLTGDLNAFHAPGKGGHHHFGLHAGDGLPDTAAIALPNPTWPQALRRISKRFGS